VLIEVSVTNYRSIRDRVTLSMEAEERLSERDKGVDERNVADTQHGRLLRVAGIYGANASGKSNLLKAMFALRWLVLTSARGQDGDELPAQPHRFDEALAQSPSEVEVVYGVAGLQVRYGVAWTRERISREWLFVRPAGEEEEVRWFERRANPLGDVDHYEAGEGWQRVPEVEAHTRKEALHVSVASQFNHEQARSVVRWFSSLLINNGLSDNLWLNRTTSRLIEGPDRSAIQDFIKSMDFGIDAVETVMMENEVLIEGEGAVIGGDVNPRRRTWARKRARIVTLRQGQTFELGDESAGTARAIAMAGPLMEALATGQTVVIDELDARLHTLLAKGVVELFQDPKVNRHNAQLIFVSHDTNLLTRTLLRRDQLWFTEKSRTTGGTELYSLAEIRLPDGKRVRNDARYEDDYLDGRYGAVPFFGNARAVLARALGGGEGE
jgi:hypothetical protein